MSVLRKILSDSAFTALLSIINILRGFVVLFLIVNLLGPDSYGIWVTIIAAVSMVSMTASVHLHGALIRYTSSDPSNNQTYSDVLSLATLIGLVTFGIGAIGSVIFSLYSPTVFGFDTPHDLVFATSTLIAVRIPLKVNLNHPRAKGFVKQYEGVRILRNVMEVTALAIIFLLGGNILAGIWGIVGVSVFLNAGIFSYVYIHSGLPRPEVHNVGKYIRYGVPMVPAALSSSLLADIDKYFLLFLLGPAPVGIYSVAERVCKPIVNLTGIFNSTLYPTIASAWDQGDYEVIEKAYEYIFRYYTILAFPGAVGLVLVAEPLLNIISTTEIARQAVPLVPIFILGYFLKGYDNPLRYILTSVERTRTIGIAVTLSLLVNVILNLTLIPTMGLSGAAIATLSAQGVLFFMILYVSFQEVRFEIPWITLVRCSVATVVMAVILMLLDLGNSPASEMLLDIGVGGLSYFAVLFLIGEFSSEDIKLVREKLQSSLQF